MIRGAVFFFIRLYRWFVPRDKWRKVPRRLISPYQMMGANENERLLMKLGVARSPQDAKLLFAKFNTDDPNEVLARLPKKRGKKAIQRLKELGRRYEGHDTSNPYERHRDDSKVIRVRYRMVKREKPNT
jgi:hypothetical protein